MLSTATVDMLVWSALGLVFLRLFRTGDGRWWLAIGAVAGIGMESKWLVLLMIASIGLAVLAVGPRTVLGSGWLPVGILLALALAAPGFVWQMAHDLPMLSVAHGISVDDGAENRILFVPMQLLYLSPVVVPVWIAGALRLWRDPELRWARSFAVAYPVLCVLLLLLGGKPYYGAGTDSGGEQGTRRAGWLARAGHDGQPGLVGNPRGATFDLGDLHAELRAGRRFAVLRPSLGALGTYVLCGLGAAAEQLLRPSRRGRTVSSGVVRRMS